MTLKQLGFSLDKIKEAIASPEFSLRAATSQLRREIEKRKAELEDIESRLRDAEQFQGGGEVRADQILQLLSRMNLFERHLTIEQQDLIKQHDLKFGPEKLDELRREWLAATEELQRAKAQNARRQIGARNRFVCAGSGWLVPLRAVHSTARVRKPRACAQLNLGPGRAS